jgi:UPF0755 protein
MFLQILIIKKILAPYVTNMDFEMVANKMSYPENVKSGRFYSQRNEAML